MCWDLTVTSFITSHSSKVYFSTELAIWKEEKWVTGQASNGSFVYININQQVKFLRSAVLPLRINFYPEVLCWTGVFVYLSS